ncbi:MAG: MaoC/PaaZ C-terminal domain-containing protein [Candidatus Dormibacteria bacterium]
MTEALAGVTAGDEMTPLHRKVTQDQIAAYADASGDHNPIHVNEEFARSVGLPGTIAHGLLGMGVLAEAVSVWAGGTDRLASISCRFSKPLLPGDTLTCAGRVVDVDKAAGTATLELEATSDRGDRVLTNGRATVRLHP